MNYHCPNCNEIIYDRTRKACGICGNALPREVLLCMAQAETLHKQAAEAEEGHKRDEAAKQKRRDGEALPA